MPRADLLDRIAKVADVSVEWLLHGGPHHPGNPPTERLSPLEKQLEQLPSRYLVRYEARARALERHVQAELRKYASQLIREHQGGKAFRPTRRPKRKAPDQ